MGLEGKSQRMGAWRGMFQLRNEDSKGGSESRVGSIMVQSPLEARCRVRCDKARRDRTMMKEAILVTKGE